jgi:uncharacterized membrane-anchored protein
MFVVTDLYLTPRSFFLSTQAIVHVIRKQTDHSGKALAGFSPLSSCFKDVPTGHQTVDVLWILAEDFVDYPKRPWVVLGWEKVNE